jgi:hypothetical protein
LVHNEPEFEVEAVLKSRQLWRREREYLIKWKGYHPIEASWVNESDMEHAQEAIEEFHTRSAKSQKRCRTWWRHHLSFSGAGSHINVPHQIASEIKAKKFQRIASWTLRMYKNGYQNGLDKWNFLRKPKSKSDSHIRAKRNLGPKRGGKQGELAGTCTCSKCIPKSWLVAMANTGSHDPIRVL